MCKIQYQVDVFTAAYVGYRYHNDYIIRDESRKIIIKLSRKKKKTQRSAFFFCCVQFLLLNGKLKYNNNENLFEMKTKLEFHLFKIYIYIF
jgi:hypothetical protein